MRCSKLERGAQRVMELINFHSLSASEAARLIREGVISSERLAEACLARVRRRASPSRGPTSWLWQALHGRIKD
jgi:hypothetical protein